MGKYLTAFGISLSALVLLGILAYTQLEIYARPRFLPPSREARSNEYLALDRWLTAGGYSVRVEGRGGPGLVEEAPEGVVFVQASLFYWPGDAWDRLKGWVEAGGSLIISLDTPWYEREDEGLDGILHTLGILEEQENSRYDFFSDPSEPGFDSGVAFSLPELPAGDPAEIMADRGGIIRLVRAKRGAGTVTFLGAASFLKNYALGREANARLAWALLAPGTREGEGPPGVLFIRGKRQVQSFFGRLAERGTLVPLLVSALILILTGLWMVVPLFGILTGGDHRPGRPLRERFLAEGRFLGKYRALESYRALYVREILRRLRRREGIDDEAALNRRFAGLWEEAAAPGSPGPEEVLRAGGGLGRRDFVKTVDTMETIWERL